MKKILSTVFLLVMFASITNATQLNIGKPNIGKPVLKLDPDWGYNYDYYRGWQMGCGYLAEYPCEFYSLDSTSMDISGTRIGNVYWFSEGYFYYDGTTLCASVTIITDIDTIHWNGPLNTSKYY